MYKLVVVGQRFRNPEHIKAARQAFKHTKSLEVKLVLEDNPKGYEGKAIGVWYNNTHVAYLRNKDLEHIFKDKHDIFQYTWKVISIHGSYWILSSNCRVTKSFYKKKKI